VYKQRVLAVLWVNLVMAGTPVQWAPVPPAIVVVSVETTARSVGSVARADLVSRLEHVIESRARAQVKVLSESDLLWCGGDPLCRIRLARSERSDVLVALYQLGGEGEVRLGLTVFTTTTGDQAANERPLFEAKDLPLPDGALDDAAFDVWLADSLAAVLSSPRYATADPVRLPELPAGTVLHLAGARLELPEAAEVTLAGLPAVPTALAVAAPDYEALSLALGPGTPAPAVALEPTPARWIRRAIFGSGIAGLGVAVVGLGGAAASAGVSGFCVRPTATDCSAGYSGWVPVAAAGAAYAVPIVVEAMMRDELEAGGWALVWAMSLSAVAGTLMVVADR
jgi:hypothetical protein